VSTAFALTAAPANATTETGKAQLKANHKEADAQKTGNEKKADASRDAAKAQGSANEDKTSAQADADEDAAKVARADTPRKASAHATRFVTHKSTVNPPTQYRPAHD
jgi:colicin import membrane protein